MVGLVKVVPSVAIVRMLADGVVPLLVAVAVAGQYRSCTVPPTIEHPPHPL